MKIILLFIRGAIVFCLILATIMFLHLNEKAVHQEVEIDYQFWKEAWLMIGRPSPELGPSYPVPVWGLFFMAFALGCLATIILDFTLFLDYQYDLKKQRKQIKILQKELEEKTQQLAQFKEEDFAFSEFSEPDTVIKSGKEISGKKG